MANLISERGSTKCRICNSNNLKSVLDLGRQPLPAEYGRDKDEILDQFPLHLKICKDCGLGQLGEYVLPERIFHKKYPYLSSASTTWIKHAESYAKKMTQLLNLSKKSLVIELASNDGYLLSKFKDLNIPVLGIEPAENVASIAQKKGVDTIVDFFGVNLAQKVLMKYGYPSLIAANNVYAHIPDMHDFTEGLSLLCNEDTIITIENPSFANLIKGTLFDTIYHEHYSYLSAHSVREVANAHGLNLFHIDQLSTHGGSNRYWLSKNKKEDESIKKVLELELEAGILDEDEWLRFSTRAKSSIDGLRNWLLAKEKAGDNVVGYGAAHKGNTFLNAVGKESKIIKYVVDASIEKQGKYLPGSQLPVYEPRKISDTKPTDVLILPWNISKELAISIRDLSPSSRIWIAQPEMKEVL